MANFFFEIKSFFFFFFFFFNFFFFFLFFLNKVKKCKCFFLFSVFLISNAFFWLKLWEDKEYNWKRLFIHLTETKQGRKIVIGTESLIKWGIILLYGTTIYSSRFDIYYHFIVFSLYTYLFIKLIIKIYNKDFHLPTFSLQAASILGLSLFFEFTVYAFAPLDRFLWLILLDKLLAFIIGIFILIFLVFFDFSKDIVVNKAAEKLRNCKNYTFRTFSQETDFYCGNGGW